MTYECPRCRGSGEEEPREECCECDGAGRVAYGQAMDWWTGDRHGWRRAFRVLRDGIRGLRWTPLQVSRGFSHGMLLLGMRLDLDTANRRLAAALERLEGFGVNLQSSCSGCFNQIQHCTCVSGA